MESSSTLEAPPTPAQRPYGPRGGAAELWYAKDREVLIEGPAGTGKSRACLEKLHRAAGKYDGMRGLIIRKTRASCTESVLVTFESKVLPEGHAVLGAMDRAHRARYTYPNGSELIVGGMDLVSRIMSTEFDLILVPEATELTEDEAETLTTRLRNGVMPYQQIIYDANPAAPTHWLNQRCQAGKTRRILSRHEDNPSVTPQYLDTLRALSGARRARLYDGRWAAQEGLVYEFDPAVHECSRADLIHWGIITSGLGLTLNWQTVREVWGGLDWGYTNPGVLWIAVLDGDGRAYFIHEIYASQHTIDWWLEAGRAVQARFNVTQWVADPSEPAYIAAWAHGTAGAGGQGPILGVPGTITPAINDIAPGIGLVRQRLAQAGDGRPRMYFYAGAEGERDPVLLAKKRPASTREEFDSYHWPKDAAGKELKEVPVKDDDHGMDVVRYLTMAWDGVPAARSAVVTGPPRFGPGQYTPPGRGW